MAKEKQVYIAPEFNGLLPGDVLLYSGGDNPGLVSLFIKVKTWSRYSHVEVYLGGNESAAARWKGVNTYPLDNTYTLVLRPFIPPDATLDLSEMFKFHRSCIGQKYHAWGLFRFFRLKKSNPDEEKKDGAICSEHATRLCRYMRVFFKTHTWSFKPFAEKFDADLVSPRDFSISPNFNIVWRIL